MTKEEVLQQLERYGNEGTKKVLMRHGAKEPFFGVKVQDLKKIQKKIKKRSPTFIRVISNRQFRCYVSGSSNSR